MQHMTGGLDPCSAKRMGKTTASAAPSPSAAPSQSLMSVKQKYAKQYSGKGLRASDPPAPFISWYRR